MSKCIRCGNEIIGPQRACNSCLRKWNDMRSLVFDKLTEIYGKLSPVNHPLFIKETKRLESIWRKDKELFTIELNKLSNG
jgi:hypothetical protein